MFAAQLSTNEIQFIKTIFTGKFEIDGRGLKPKNSPIVSKNGDQPN